MDAPSPQGLETDPRFPSGRWLGFFQQKQLPRPGKHQMELLLTFKEGDLRGEGRDWVGKFIVHGRYNLDSGEAWFHKRYVGRHDVFYHGYNEGKGIWGTWEIPPDQNLGMNWTGGFHIWPEGLADPTGDHLAAHADAPVELHQAKKEPALV